MSAGTRFRKAAAEERPLQVIGAINAYHARMAQHVGYRALYLSGGGVAAGSLGLPDLGISNLDDVLTDIRRITDACDLPLLVDVDTLPPDNLPLPSSDNVRHFAASCGALCAFYVVHHHVLDRNERLDGAMRRRRVLWR